MKTKKTKTLDKGSLRILSKLKVNDDFLAARPFLSTFVKAYDKAAEKASEWQKRELLMMAFLGLRKLCE